MAWYHIPGNEQDVAISTEVRISRNLSELPFTPKLDAARARDIITRVGTVLEKNGFSGQDHGELSRTAAYALVEKQYTTAAFVRESLPHAVFLNEPCNLAVTVGVEEHIRLQAIYPGLSLRDATAAVLKVESLLDETFSFAFDDRLGYLTRSPEDIGTGMRAGVLLCLPILSSSGRLAGIGERLGQTGFALRPLGGVGTGDLYRLSNRLTLGMSEEETVQSLEEAVRRLCDSERRAREAVSGAERDRLWDRICRSAAILRGARLLSVEETVRMLTDIRLGAALGILREVKVETVTTLLMEALPATLSLQAESEPHGEHERAAVRARLCAELFA